MFYLLTAHTGAGLHNASFNAPDFGLLTNIDTKISTILLILMPVLFLPLLAKKWLILFIPFLLLMFVTNNAIYQFPALFMLQYPTIFIPSIFIGSIYGLEYVNSETNDHSKLLTRTKSEYSRRLRNFKKLNFKIPMLIIVISLLFMTVYQPYGPFQNFSSEDYGLGNILASNHTEYNEINQLISLIPTDSPYVFFQNSMPEVLPRSLCYQGTPLMPYTVAQNFTHQLSNGTWTKVTIDYAIFNPYSSFFNIPGTPPYNMTAYWFLRALLGTGNYGILAEENGMIVLEKNYKGEPKFFSPYQRFIPASLLSTQGNRTPSTVYAINPTGEAISFGPYTYLSPGNYKIQYEMKVSK